MRLRRNAFAIALSLGIWIPCAAQDVISIELNKLEAEDDACRMHLVVNNAGTETFDSYQLDLVIFDKDEVIAKRTAVDISPVRAAKTTVYAFSVTDMSCDRFGKVLLNDVTGCGSATSDCAANVSVSSRAAVKLVK